MAFDSLTHLTANCGPGRLLASWLEFDGQSADND